MFRNLIKRSNLSKFQFNLRKMCDHTCNTVTEETKKTKNQVFTKKKAKKVKPFSEVFNEHFPTTLPYVDTHCHMDAVLRRVNTDPKTEEILDLETFMERNHLGSFEKCVTVCCEPKSYDVIMDLLNEDKTGKVYAAFGVHPHEAELWNEEIQLKFEKAMEHPRVLAWGECGLDYFYDNAPRDVQKEVFIKQIELAVKHKKPLVVHTREAEEDTVEIMKQHLPSHWIVHIHCCTSSSNMVQPLLDHFPNLHVGFTGCITFNNAQSIRDTLSIVPLNRLLLETDAPYMAPIPFRGQIAHPGMIPFIAKEMANTKGVSIEEVFTVIRENTKNVYGI